MDDGELLAHRRGGLGEGVALPAEQVKEVAHQEAGGEVGALAGEAEAQRLFGRVVGPDEVAG